MHKDKTSKLSIDNLEGTVAVKKGKWLRRLFVFIGPAYLVSIGYMDPGNWATDIEGGARFGYALLWVILMSNLMALLLQTLSARLGIVTGLDLAQGCRREYSKFVVFFLWILAEIAIAATDLAEVIGTIIGLNLLFGIPLLWGAGITAFDTFLLLAIQRLGVRKMEAFIVALIGTIGACFLVEIFFAQPSWKGIAAGFIPHLDSSSLYIAIGIIGATVMPHNLYLHSSLVQSRKITNTYTGKTEACKFNLIDSAIALNVAFFVNAAILVVAAAVFFNRGIVVTEIQQAYQLLEPILGSKIAPIAFALALLIAGQSSTLTGTLSGQIVMEGFLNIKMRPWLRRMLTRSLALIPAIIVIIIAGSEGTYKMLILSQVVLSLQLPFAIIPLLHFTSDKNKMGKFVNRLWVKILGWFITVLIVVLNLKLVLDELSGWIHGAPFWLWIIILPLLLFLLGVLVFITIRSFRGKSTIWTSKEVSTVQDIASKIKPVSFKNIGVALEHSQGDAEIISAAISLAKQNHARLTLIHVVETPGTFVFGKDSDSLHSREDESYLESLTREIEERDLAVEFMLCFGKPADEIVKAVNESDIDFLVFGSHGHRGIEDVVFGQTASTVRHEVDIPVLIVQISSPRIERPQRNKP
ncbi:MAG: iron/manganese transporter [FCB group bacterium]|nr:iron/manganese transporter [FCB group bacterium]